MPHWLPASVYVTIALLLGIVALFTWLVATYPDQPSQRAFTDTCKTIAKENNRAQQNQDSSRNSVTSIESGKPTLQADPRGNQDDKSDTDRRLAEYTCQLAIYTAQLASFTKWLVIVTFGPCLSGCHPTTPDVGDRRAWSRSPSRFPR
jgi:hypothetical protein